VSGQILRKWLLDFVTLLLWCGIASLAAAGILKVVAGLGSGSLSNFLLGSAELVFVAAIYWAGRELLRCALLFAVFTGLAGVSAYHLYTNVESCGCFGFINVAPLAMFAFDSLVAFAACTAFVWHREGNTGFFQGASVCAGRCCCAGLLVASVAPLVSDRDKAQVTKQVDSSLVALGARMSEISNAFVIDMADGDWDVTILRQSCPSCIQLLADGRVETETAFVVMFVDDACAFYSEDTSDGLEFFVSPILTGSGTDDVVVTPSSMRMRDGKIVEFRSLSNSKGV